MNDVHSLVHSMEELLIFCSRSIVAPDMITEEANRIMETMNDHNLDQKFIVEGHEALSLLASGFIRCGYDNFMAHYAQKTGTNPMVSGFCSKDELVQYCAFCVEFGEKNLQKIKDAMMMRLEAENKMTQEEIYSINLEQSGRNPATVQALMVNYLKLSLLVNSLKEFFKEYYKGMN